MTSISATAASPSFSSQGKGPTSPPHLVSVEELTNWFSSELHLLCTNNVRTPTVVPTQASNSRGPESADANYHQGHPEGITTFATAIIPFSGRAVPTMVTLCLVPLHLGTGQYSHPLNPSSPPSLDQGGEPSLFSPSHPLDSSRLSADCPMTGSGLTIDPRYLEYAPSPGDFQHPGHGDSIQVPIPDGIPAAVTASPGMAVYPPSFNQAPEPYSGHPPPPSPVDNGLVLPVHSAYQNEGSELPTSQQLIGQTYQDITTLSITAGPIQGVQVDQHPSRYQCTMCDADYPSISARNRHCKDVHLPLIACDFCGLGFSSGRKYLLTQHLEARHPNASLDAI